jgi:hypothetical protein
MWILSGPAEIYNQEGEDGGKKESKKEKKGIRTDL